VPLNRARFNASQEFRHLGKKEFGIIQQNFASEVFLLPEIILRR
jgi:hypothetical protein